MLIVELPVLPRVSILKGKTFQSVLFCRFVSLAGQKKRLDHSQRQVLSLFNRSQQRAISRHFVAAQDAEILVKVHHTQGADPDVYIRGKFFVGNSSDSRALKTMSRSLWGSKGLLKTFPFQTAWGHGCLSPGVILCLATLCALNESISKKSLRRYLSPLIYQSSFDTALRFLKEHHLVFGDAGRLVIAPDWESKVRAWLDTNPKCNERHQKGERRRKAESDANLVRVAKGKLTDAELKQLLALPCVVKGCKSKSEQQEHFPPKKFLKQLDVITNRHFVWSICSRHNRDMADFIKLLDSTIPIPPVLLVMRRGSDPMRIYSAAVDLEIQKFYATVPNQKGKPVPEEDFEAAQQAIISAIGLWKAIDKLPEKLKNRSSPQKHSLREVVGKRSYFPSHSKLPYQKN